MPHRSLHPPYRHVRRAQRGAVAVMVVAMLFVILATCAMAIDLGLMYNRRVELQNLADATALSAAAQLDGTEDGIDRAVASAATVAATFHYNYVQPVTWSNTALQFGKSPDQTDGWIAAADAHTAATANGRLFARVDTTALGATGLVRTVFMQALGVGRDATMRGLAVAGRTGVKVAPLAICAMSNTAIQSRPTDADPGGELVEFGFRRGISYDLMNLNPHGARPANYAVNPFAPPGMPGTAGPTSPSIIGPYLCTGTMSMARVTGGDLTIASGFPIRAVYPYLNARFDDYSTNACNRLVAPADANIKSYDATGANFPWMKTAPLGQSAAALPGSANLVTVAEAPASQAGITAGMYGPLWTYARAVPYSAFVSGKAEPAAGYTGFSSDAWNKLYTPGQPKADAYAIPYQATSGSTFKAPSGNPRAQRNRRVLNIPLLACPITDGVVNAAALGVGRFFMTVPATDTALYAEFAGIVSDQALGATTGLFR